MAIKFDINMLPEKPDLSFEQALWQQGLLLVAGVDEAGRGPIAGPVSAAAVIFPPDNNLEKILPGVNDSKQMTPVDREYWADRIKETALYYGIGFSSSLEIDRQGIVPAIYQAIDRAITQMPCQVEHMLVDYIRIPNCSSKQTPLVKGDARSLSIAAASILAKTARDALMIELGFIYPGYGFDTNKGYGTRAHLQALTRLGPCPIHRRSFRPLFEESSLSMRQKEEEIL